MQKNSVYVYFLSGAVEIMEIIMEYSNRQSVIIDAYPSSGFEYNFLLFPLWEFSPVTFGIMYNIRMQSDPEIEHKVLIAVFVIEQSELFFYIKHTKNVYRIFEKKDKCLPRCFTDDVFTKRALTKWTKWSYGIFVTNDADLKNIFRSWIILQNQTYFNAKSFKCQRPSRFV